jgi:excisionase family DNA binding protein
MKKSDGNMKVWMTKKDVMRYLQKARRTIDNWMSNGVIRYHRCGGSIFFDKDELDEDIRRRK